jgi:hypothetical protein
MKSSITSGLNKVIGWFKNLIGKKGVKAVEKATHTGKHVAQHQAQHSVVHAGAAALTGGGGHH